MLYCRETLTYMTSMKLLVHRMLCCNLTVLREVCAEATFQQAPLEGRFVLLNTVHAYITLVIWAQAGWGRRGAGSQHVYKERHLETAEGPGGTTPAWLYAVRDEHQKNWGVSCDGWLSSWCRLYAAHSLRQQVRLPGVWRDSCWTYHSLRWCKHWRGTAACPAWRQHRRVCRGSGCVHEQC